MKTAKTKYKLLGIGAGIVTLVALGLGAAPEYLPLGSMPEAISGRHEESSLVVTDRRKVGDEYSSHIILNNQGSFRFGQGSEGISQKVTTRLHAKITEILVDHDGQGSTSLLVLSNAAFDISINDQNAEEFRQQILGDLTRGALVKRSASGLITDVRAPLDVKDFSRDILYAIVKSTQYHLPEGTLGSQWKSVEDDSNGRYEALYTLDGENEGIWSIGRERTFFHSLNAQIAGDLGKPSLEGVPSGKVTLSYDARTGVVRSIRGKDAVAYIDENQEKIGLNEQEIDWRFDHHRTLSASELQEFKDLVTRTFSSSKTYEELRSEAYANQIRSIHENHLGQDSIDDVLRSFAGLESFEAKEKQQKLTDLLQKLRAYIYLHPEAMPSVPDIISQHAAESDVFHTFVSALVNISSPEAQQALIDTALKLRTDPAAMQALVPALGFIKGPLPAVEETLKTLRRDESSEVQNMADLSLGILGSQLAKTSDPTESKARLENLATELVQEAQAAKNTPEFSHHLDVLGNLASDKALPLVTESLRHDDVKVRATAAAALRDIDGPESLQLLAGVLQGEKEADVRLSAASALESYRPRPELLTLEEQVLAKEPDHRVRIQLLQNIARARHVDVATVKRVLETSSETDAHEQTRNYAQNLLLDFNS